MIILNRYMHWVTSYISIKYIKKITVKCIRIQRNWKILIILRLGYFEDQIFFKIYQILKHIIVYLKWIIDWNHYFILYTHLTYSTALNWMLMWCITSQHWHFWMLLYFLNKSCMPTSFKWDVFLIKMQSSAWVTAWVTVFAYTISIFK